MSLAKRFCEDDKGSEAAKQVKLNDGSGISMADLSLTASSHDKAFPYFRRPRILGSFSLDAERKFCHDRHQLKFFNQSRFKNSSQPGSSYKRVSWDLNLGVDSAILKDADVRLEEGISSMLRWILLNKDSFRVVPPPGTESQQQPHTHEEKLSGLSTDIVCYRGLLTTVMCSPYERREGWQVLAVKWKGTIYLRQVDTDAKRSAEANKTDRQKQMCSWGYKFEQYVVSSMDDQDPSDEQLESLPAVNENEEFCCVYRGRLGGHSVVYGAEMDGFQLRKRSTSSEEQQFMLGELDLNQDGHFVELKTCRVIDSPRLETNFARHKVIKWWCQCFLVGIPVVVVGFRDDDGMVQRLADYPTTKFPSIGANFWLPNVCMNFLDGFLKSVKTSVQEELKAYRFSWEPPSQRVNVEALRDEDSVKLVLPNWYTEQLFK